MNPASVPHFTVAYACVLIVAFLPIVCAGLAKARGKGGATGDKNFNNYNPRAWLQSLSGWPARANAAQANTFEALPLFIGGVIIAHQLGADQNWIDGLAVAFVVARVLYIGLYLGNLAWLRSLVWAIGLGLNVALFFAGR